MLFERRAIVFARADLLDAMRLFALQAERPMPDTPPDAFSFDPDRSAVALAVTFSALPGEVATRFVFSLTEVRVALINHCRLHGVPLPRNADKTVEKYRDGAALTMQIGEPALHLMLIDGQRVARALMRKSLARLNATFLEADSAPLALDMLRDGGNPDVILCAGSVEWDDFLRQLRADRGNRNCRKPVLILTGNRSDTRHDAVMHLGASKVLMKPIAPEELIRQIHLARGYFEVKRGGGTSWAEVG